MPLVMLESLNLGECPRVVGTVTKLTTLVKLIGTVDPGCDIVELRLDHVGAEAPGWIDACEDLEAAGIPLIVTLRHASEGGRWNGGNEERLALLGPALRCVAAVDVEIGRNAVASAVEAAVEEGNVVIGSYHHFERTPPVEVLESIVKTGRDQGADIVKLATWIHSDDDVDRLRGILETFADFPVSVLGMGPLGSATRVSLPVAGSCLTYGFIDESAAPGQIAAPDLREKLREACPSYRPARS